MQELKTYSLWTAEDDVLLSVACDGICSRRKDKGNSRGRSDDHEMDTRDIHIRIMVLFVKSHTFSLSAVKDIKPGPTRNFVVSFAAPDSVLFPSRVLFIHSFHQTPQPPVATLITIHFLNTYIKQNK